MRPCPTCLASHRLLTISHLRLSPKGFLATRARLPSSFLAKRPVTSATTTTSPPTGVEPLTVLHKTVALLPRIPNYDEGPNSRYTEANRLWEATLSKVYEDFSAVSDRPIRIAGQSPVLWFLFWIRLMSIRNLKCLGLMNGRSLKMSLLPFLRTPCRQMRNTSLK